MSHEARVTPPDLQDSSKFVKLSNVPILDVHVRHHVDPDTGEQRTTYVDSAQLQKITDNSNKRATAGEIPLVFVGHTKRGAKETHQPPIVGYMPELRVGKYRGKDTILADVYMDKICDLDDKGKKPYGDVLKQFPRRSVEVFRKMQSDGYIDAVALLKVSPERGLGYITYQNGEKVEIFQRECPSEGYAYMDNDQNPAANPPDMNEGQVPDPPDADPVDPSLDPNMPVRDPGEEMAEDAAIDKIATALAIKICANEGLVNMIAAKMSQSVSSQMVQQVVAIMKGTQNAPSVPPSAEGGNLPVNPKGTENPATDEAGDTTNPPPPEQKPASAPEKKSETNDKKPPPFAKKDGKKEEPEKMANDNEQDLIIDLGVLTVELKKTNERLAAVVNENVDLRARLDAAETFQKEQKFETTKQVRKGKLETLAGMGYEIDPDRDIDRYAKLNDEDWNDRVVEIETKWTKSIVGAAPVQTQRLNGAVQNPSAKENFDSDPDQATEEERRTHAVVHFRDAHPELFSNNDAFKRLSPATQGVRIYEAFMADKKSKRLAREAGK